MRIVLYEWCCSGGLAGCGAAGDIAAIAAEGRAMLEALAVDAARDASLHVTVLVDPARQLTLPPSAHAATVHVDDTAALVAAACGADWTVIVAPETDRLLLSRVAAVRSAGGHVLGASNRFIEIAGDKQATIDALAAAGVPVPAGRSLAAGERVPVDFQLPAVLKARDGVGCDGFSILEAVPMERVERVSRLEAFFAGTPVGVSCICGHGRIDVLHPMRQCFGGSNPPRYAGGEPLEPGATTDRARVLARRAVAAVIRAAGEHAEPSLGWVGVDMILGARDDGRADRVLEVNPRLTTSFVRLAAAAPPRSLVRTMIDTVEDTQVRDGRA